MTIDTGPPSRSGWLLWWFGSVVVILLVVMPISQASAFEYVLGPGQSCSAGRDVAINAFLYGDYNVYSNYGLEGYSYNIPYGQGTYVYEVTNHQSITSSAADAENYIDGPVGTACWP